mmetsp:Transcript_9113/g.23917  ORF Transcript_9113/g.23917 Transcript_9113/m.23917 type:complete len:99 (+) Transcript_9113:224-520(+)
MLLQPFSLVPLSPPSFFTSGKLPDPPLRDQLLAFSTQSDSAKGLDKEVRGFGEPLAELTGVEVKLKSMAPGPSELSICGGENLTGGTGSTITETLPFL